MTRRIQIPDVEAAVELSGAKLERYVTLERQGDGRIHCCPIGALAHVECGLEPEEDGDHGVNLDVAGDALRLDPRYREAFATAFDAWPRRVFDEEIISRKPAYEQLGYADGFDVADAMMPRTEAVDLDADHPLDDGGDDE